MRRHLLALSLGFCMHAIDAGGVLGAQPADTPQVIRVGMIGLDTSHVPAFTKIFNKENAEGNFAKLKIVAGYPGGTDIPASRDRVAGFTEQIREMGVEIVQTIPELLERVDVVLLESVDGRIHLEEAVPVILAGKPLFIDKPAAGSLADTIAIYDLAKKHGVPIFSSSSLRYSPSIQELLTDESLGEIVGAVTWGPCSYQSGIPDLFFYGVHGVEMLYALMGTGCETVTRLDSRDADVVSGRWSDGRIGTYRGIRKHAAPFGAIAFGTKAVKPAERTAGYQELCEQIAEFFVSGKSPVDAETTIELFAFMEASDESKRLGGQPVSIPASIAAAREASVGRLAEFLPAE